MKGTIKHFCDGQWIVIVEDAQYTFSSPAYFGQYKGKGARMIDQMIFKGTPFSGC